MHELPPWAPETSGYERDEPCRRCGRTGFFDKPHEPLRIAYRESDLDLGSIPDVTSTWERFGYAWVTPPSGRHTAPFFGVPRLLVRPRVRLLLREAGVTHVKYEPIALVD